jgi:tRNA pseudouridine38-40 synthase
MALKMLVDDSIYMGGDTEGVAIADAVNAHLPPNIRVFTVQRVNKKFNARHMADSRTYEYYLPAHMLGM